MVEKEALFHNLERLIKAIEILQVPILWTEQAPDKIGPTVSRIRDILFPIVKPVAKRSFSCWDCEDFVQALRLSGRRQVIMAGIETHVCVYRTARDLHTHGYEVCVAADATSARNQMNKDVPLLQMCQDGITVITTEAAICELLKSADHPKFKDVIAYIK